MRARKYIIAGLIFWAVLILFLIINSLHHRPKQVDLYRSTPGGTNIIFPYLAGPHTIDFFTGAGFASYDTKNQTSTSISPQFILPTVSQARWSKTGVLFQASDYTNVDDLYKSLAAKQLPPNQEYWWLYDFATQKINVVLPGNPLNNVADAFWNSSGTNYCLISTDGSLYLSNDPQKAIKAVGTGARIKQFSGNTITLAQGNVLKQINTNGSNVRGLAIANFQDSYVSPDNKTAAYVLNTQPKATGVTPGDLYKVDPVTGKARKVLAGFTGALAGSGGDLYAGYTNKDGGGQFELFPESGKTIAYSLGGALNKGDKVDTILPVNPGTIYIVSKSTNLVAVTNQKTTVSTPINNDYKIQTDLYENGFEIHYDPYKNTYEIDIAANPYFTYQAAALKYIRAQTIDPNQINITWRPYTGVDSTNPAVDRSPIPALSVNE